MTAAISSETTAEVWSRYWRTGVLHSCCLDFAGNYQGSLADFWGRQFAAAPDSAVVVDLGTGNGAIPLLAKAHAYHHARTSAVHGVDLAEISPTERYPDRRFDGITFHPKTSMLSLPFADGSVDLICGQYAVEYVEWPRLVVELARVVRVGGRIAFLMHTTDSRVYASTLDLLESFDVLHASGFLEGARALAPFMARRGSAAGHRALRTSSEAEGARRSFNASAQQLMNRIETAKVSVMLTRVLNVTAEILGSASASGPQSAASALSDLERELHDERYRLLHLREAALTPERLGAAVVQLLEAGYMDPVAAPLDQSPDVRYGWTLSARRGP